MKDLKIGIIREGKKPADSRVPLVPEQCKYLIDKYPSIDIVIQPSPVRSYKDEEYLALGIPMNEDLSDREILLGVKEVPIDQLIPNKTYFFFSHTIKEQVYNRKLLRAILEKNIRMIDYETLVNTIGNRIIGFGRYAGIVGAHNAVRAYGLGSKKFELEAAYKCKDFEAIKEIYKGIEWPNFKIVSTGTGKVARGAQETLKAMGIREVSRAEFETEEFDEAVFVHLTYDKMYKRKSDDAYIQTDFFENPGNYYCDFRSIMRVADIFINGIYWDNRGPVYFTQEDMADSTFNIKVISDVTCDIAPASSVPSTLRATKIGNDLFGYDPITGSEVATFTPGSITVMSVDNLPNELPRDASLDFGKMLMDSVLKELTIEGSPVIEKATITKDGELTELFSYLQDYVDGGGEEEE